MVAKMQAGLVMSRVSGDLDARCSVNSARSGRGARRIAAQFGIAPGVVGS
jgi:hypothetical protein